MVLSLGALWMVVVAQSLVSKGLPEETDAIGTAP
jgi:hypothetical protein